jgi:hypothetical protein
LDPALTEHILTLARESDLAEGMTVNGTLTEHMIIPIGAGKKPLDEPEDKAIARLGITYGVLRRLRFSEARVNECLNAINGVDLEDAYEWVSYRLIETNDFLLILVSQLYMHCTEEELGDKSIVNVFYYTNSP